MHLTSDRLAVIEAVIAGEIDVKYATIAELNEVKLRIEFHMIDLILERQQSINPLLTFVNPTEELLH